MDLKEIEINNKVRPVQFPQKKPKKAINFQSELQFMLQNKPDKEPDPIRCGLGSSSNDTSEVEEESGASQSSDCFDSSDGFQIIKKTTKVSKKSGNAQSVLAAQMTTILEPGEFIVNGRVIRKAATTLCCKIDNYNEPRKFMVRLILHSQFDNFITANIIMNSIVMAIYDYYDHNRCAYENVNKDCPFSEQNGYNQLLNSLSSIFGVIFSIECALKIYAFGFINGYKTYLRSWWNVLDFVIILSFILESIQLSTLNVRGLRALRILRPLKVAQFIPSLKKQVNVLIKSINGLINVVLFLLFFFALFSIAGVHFFSNSMNYTCRVGKPPVPTADGKCQPWVKYSDFNLDVRYKGVCTPPQNQLIPFIVEYSTCENEYNYDSVCGSLLNEGFDSRCLNEVDNQDANDAIQFGIGGFDNFGEALLAIFQIITLDNWSPIMYNLGRWNTAPIISTIFCIVLIFFVSFYLLQLMLAVVMESYIDYEKQERNLQKKKFTQKREMLAKRLEALKFTSGDNALKRSITFFSGKAKQTDEEKKIKNEKVRQKKLEKEQKNKNDELESSQDSESENEEFKELEGDVQKSIDQGKLTRTGGVYLMRRLSMRGSSAAMQQAVEAQAKLDRQMLNFDQQEERKKGNQIKYGMDIVKQKTITNIPLVESDNDEDVDEMEGGSQNSGDSSPSPYDSQSSGGQSCSEAEGASAKLNNTQENKEKFQEIQLLPEIKEQTMSMYDMMTKSKLQLKVEKKPSESDRGNNMERKQTAKQYENQQKRRQSMLRAKLAEREKTQERSLKSMRGTGLLRGGEEEQKDTQANKIYDQAQKESIAMTFALRILQKTDQIMRKEKLEKRADGNLLYRCSYKLVRAKPFNHLISVCILVNTVTLAMDCHPMDVLQEQIIEYTNILFYFVFLLEMIFKLTGLGFGEYTRLRSNIFDMAIVILSTFDFIFFVLSAFTEVNFEKVSSIALVFRIFRTLRILKLANTWPRLSFFLKTMLDTINSVGSFGILLSIFIFMYAILGMELLSYSLKMTRLDKPVDYFATGNPEVSDVYSVPDSNFDGFVNATLSVFIVLANDGWTDVFFDYYRTVGGGMSSIFFISLVVLGQMILLNLFLSMMLEKFDDDKFERESQKDSFRKASGECMKKCQTWAKRNQTAESKDRTLYCFGKQSKFRNKIKGIVDGQCFEKVITVLIVVQSFVLALENPLNDPDGNLMLFLFYFDILTTTCFTLEIIFQSIAKGLLLNGPNSYLRSGAQILDFIIVFCSLISILNLSDLTIFKILRAIRLFRSLRLISRNEGLKLSMKALMAIVPSVASLMVLSSLIMFIFGIIGVNLLKGKSFYCFEKPMIGLSLYDKEMLISTKEDCLNYGGLWLKYDTNFDNVFTSTTQFIIMSQLVEWPNIMYRIVNANGPDLAPGYKVGWNQYIIAPVFMLFVLIGGFFIMNLFVLVVISAFNRETTKLGWDFLLSDVQKKWMKTKILVSAVKPKIAFLKMKDWHKCRKLVYDIVMSQPFEAMITIAILASTFLMTITWANMSEIDTWRTEMLQRAFSLFFMVEIVLKLIAFKLRFFKDKWNIFDFVIVVFPFIFGILIQMYDFGALNKTMNQAVRSMRIGRLFKLFRVMKRLQVIQTTFMNTISSLMNIAVLMFLIIYIYSVFAVNFFADVKVSLPLHDRLNFQDIWTSFVTLIRASTGEWDDVMFALSYGHSQTNKCTYNPTFADYKANGYQTVGCGNWKLSYTFFLTFLVFINLIFLNLFIAIILNGYFMTINQTFQYLNPDRLQKFIDSWSKLDPDAIGEIPTFQFKTLMEDMEPPFGWEEDASNAAKERYMHMTNDLLEDESGFLKFNNVLDTVITLSIIEEQAKTALQKHKVAMEEKEKQQEREEEERKELQKVQEHYKEEKKTVEKDKNAEKRKSKDEDSMISEYFSDCSHEAKDKDGSITKKPTQERPSQFSNDTAGKFFYKSFRQSMRVIIQAKTKLGKEKLDEQMSKSAIKLPQTRHLCERCKTNYVMEDPIHIQRKKSMFSEYDALGDNVQPKDGEQLNQGQITL